MASPELASSRLSAPVPRRVMTAPVGASTLSPESTTSSTPSASQDASKTTSEELVETLYSHPSARIISFTSNHRYDFTRSSDNDIPPGSLPPSSGLERTIAIGAFQIYRAPGSVAFLSCGSALQPILPKSQCWCLDEDNSRFVLQIRRPQYWRIEIPVDDPQDVLLASLLRDVFDRILLFEKTPCPFQRSFTVELPDSPETPIKKKAWTAEGKNLISSPFESDLSPPAHEPIAISRGKHLPNTSRFWLPGMNIPAGDEEAFRSWAEAQASGSDDGDAIAPRNVRSVRHHTFSGVDSEQAIETMKHDRYSKSQSLRVKGESERTTPQDSKSAQLEVLSISSNEDGDDGPSFEGSGRVAPVNLSRKRVTRMLAGRSFNARPPISHVYSDSSRSKEPVAAKNTPSSSPAALARDHSSSTSTDSFHSAQSSRSRATPLSASPRTKDVSTEAENAEVSELGLQTANASEHASTSDNTTDVAANPSATPDHLDSAGPASQLTDNEPKGIKTEDKESSSKASPSPSESRRTTSEGKLHAHQRSHASSLSISRPALSPLPSAADLFSAAPKQTTPQSRFTNVRQLPSSIVQKILGVLLGPPSYLIKLMLKVAAKIASGEWRGLVLGFGDAGEEIPVQWDYYSDGEFSDLSDGDDYTVTNSSSDVGGHSAHTGARRRIRPRRNDDDDNWEVD
ncbi:hypothetical protein NPX13_g3986 [Xylaria arbuscula]|uniref:Inheritance of peroxisomes protein 1 n=1 Tax=Xylaria arbuscula TaxID=114810 RepID=A0A9W8TPK0_9PEZI|nr:hypothetical protein NPX13_g3986 [Xylaria arbuscula]